MPLLKFGKKPETDTQQDSQTKEIPKELPTLANEPEQPEAAAEMDDVPDELPSLNGNGDLSPTLKEIKSAEDIVPEELVASEPQVTEKPEMPMEPEIELAEPEKKGFFSNIKALISRNKSTEEMVKGMKDYWKKEDGVEQEIKTNTHLKLEQEFNTMIEELQQLEGQWLGFNRDFEQLQLQMKNIEAEIIIKSEEIKAIAKKLEFLESIQKRVAQPKKTTMPKKKTATRKRVRKK